jgi:predicted phosphodiesterase
MVTKALARVAALYDIHGNLPALEAVLEDVRRTGVDQIIVGGDVFPGPMPRETLACLVELEIPTVFIYGNGDREVLAQIQGTETAWFRSVPEIVRAPVRWTAEQLGAEHDRRLAGWPGSTRVEIHGLGDVLFCHATPRNDTECFTRQTPDDRLVAVFDGVRASMVVCGHTHMQFDRRIGHLRVVNAGSVGMPFGDPGAYWLLLGPDARLRATRYDLASAGQRIRRTTYPQADDFAARHVLQPPSEAAMLELFARAELK